MDIKTLEKAKLMIEEMYVKKLSDKKMWEELREEGISIGRRKVSKMRESIGPPTHRPYGAFMGLTDKQWEWWSLQEDHPLLMRRMVEMIMSLDSEQLELFKLGKIRITTSLS